MSHPFARRIQEVYPEMPIADVQSERLAQHYFVLTINQSLVFRVARDDAGAAALKRETEFLLPAVGRAVALPVPQPAYAAFERMEAGAAFMGYPRIAGEPLWPEELSAGDLAAYTDRAAEDLAEFLHGLHAIEPRTLPPEFADGDSGFAAEGQSARLASSAGGDGREAVRLSVPRLYARIQTELFPLMSAAIRDRAERDFGGFLRRSAEQLPPRALIHGAMGPVHILHSGGEPGISGIVGFGSARFGDPAEDLAGILAGYGEAFFLNCLERYPGGDALEERARFHARVFPLREALYGLDGGDEDSLGFGMQAYEKEQIR
ncbi:aminoglycoside phosphotransferase family protein [Saccharibacillus sp. CPCC 101409]|uniref:phosphotransferase family protein n=1 Tax=Saccharibacillus sp. CPCC 101409 TaxID=3058041 RepID=UPI002672852E|nr:aminoglycoside phosphotransferase family protein [Saccharibacillus sp. CPCC 101409]MDO3412197.1 aminoglycoside phosphotransferase family protein [Saccharibacillus sp. CPCC 101409]